MPHMNPDTKKELRDNTDIKKEERYHAVYWIPKDEVRVREYYSQGKSQSAISCVLGKILAKDAWGLSEKEFTDIGVSTKSKSKNDMWLVSVYID